MLGTGRSRKRDKCQNTEVYPQVETEPCPCEVFTSQPHGNWSDCIIQGAAPQLQLGMPSQGVAKECGQGVRLRAIACYDSTGRLVEPSHCSSSGKEMSKGPEHVWIALPGSLWSLSEVCACWNSSHRFAVGIGHGSSNIFLLFFNTEVFLSVRVCWHLCNGNEAQEGWICLYC